MRRVGMGRVLLDEVLVEYPQPINIMLQLQMVEQ